MIEHVMTAACLACMGTLFVWLANPKRTWGDKMLTVSFIFGIIIGVLAILYPGVHAAQWGG